MDYYDLHVRFKFEGYSEAGFSKVGVWGTDLEEFSDNRKSEKLVLLESRDSSYLKPRIKRSTFVHNPSYELDLGVIRAVAKHKKAFEVPVRPLLLSSGIERAVLMKRLKRFLAICNKLGADYALTSRAGNIYELKHPAELIAIGCSLGLVYDQSLRAITEVPKRLMGL
ncbi:MAG: RNase P subunit p30 family protein [Candidatus Micrarchaeota archaeon]